MRRCAGFTLPEVMIAVAALGSLAAIVGSVGKALHEEDRHTASFARDLSTLEKAVDLLDDDLRSGAYASAGWSVSDGRLLRGSETIARDVTRFDVRPDGEGVRVRLSISPGNAAPGTRGAVHADWTVRPRLAAPR